MSFGKKLGKAIKNVGKTAKNVAVSPYKTVSRLAQGDLSGAFNAAMPMISPGGAFFGLDKMFQEPKPLGPIDYSSMYDTPSPVATDTGAYNSMAPTAPPTRAEGIRATPIANALMQRRDNQASDRRIGDRTI